MGVTKEQVQERIERLKDFVKNNHLSLTELEGLRHNSTGFYIEQEEQAVQVTISSQGGIRVIGEPGRLRSLLATWGKKENARYSESGNIREMAEPFLTKKRAAIRDVTRNAYLNGYLQMTRSDNPLIELAELLDYQVYISLYDLSDQAASPRYHIVNRQGSAVDGDNLIEALAELIKKDIQA